MSESFSCHPHYDQACEFVVPIKLVVPIFLEPKVLVKSICVRESLQVYLQPEIHLEPEVNASSPVCLPQNGYLQETLIASVGEE
jgi:hypothetical protein